MEGERLRALPRSLWRGWRGKTGDELLWLVAASGLIAYGIEDNPHPDLLAITLIAVLGLLSRFIDRTQEKGDG